MKNTIKNLISGVGSLLDISGEYDDNISTNSPGKEKTDVENIRQDFEKVGNDIRYSMKIKREDKQLQFDFEESKLKNNLSLSH